MRRAACARKLTRTGICVPQLAPGDPVEGMWDRECWGPAGGCAAERAAFLRLKMLPRSAAWQGLRDAAGTSNLCPGKNRRRDAYRHARYTAARLWCWWGCLMKKSPALPCYARRKRGGAFGAPCGYAWGKTVTPPAQRTHGGQRRRSRKGRCLILERRL